MSHGHIPNYLLPTPAGEKLLRRMIELVNLPEHLGAVFLFTCPGWHFHVCAACQ